MSKKRLWGKNPLGLRSEDGMVGDVRAALGHQKYGFTRPKYPTTRRLKCDRCKKTWKFSDKLNYSPCPACKEGRLS